MNNSFKPGDREPRPAEVTRAVRLLWLMWAVGLLRLMLHWKQLFRLDQDGIADAICVVLAFVIFGFLICKTGRGENEGRLVLLALSAIALTSSVATTDWHLTPGGLFLSLVEMYPIVLLISAPSRRWFAAMKDTTRVRPERPAAHA